MSTRGYPLLVILLLIAPYAYSQDGRNPSEKPVSKGNKPLKIFVLAGQSNMQGHVNVSTFDYMSTDPKTAPLLKEMRGPDGKPKVCEKVWISSIGCAGDDVTEQTGNLTAGFGASKNCIGPEFTFGITLEKMLDQPILIIKTSWGGKDLHTNFRSPSAGPYEWGTFELEARRKRGDNMEKEKADKIKATGASYRRMIEHIKKVLGDLKRVVPDYDSEQGYEIAGFVWFQGFNDLVSTWTYPNHNKPGGYDLYSTLLTHFIRDVRKELNSPKMPFVIGVMGLNGFNPPQNEAYFHIAQAAPASLPEFMGNVVAVETAPFWDAELSETRTRVQALWPKADAALAEALKNTPHQIRDGEAFKAKFIADCLPPEIANRMNGVSNFGFHYLGAAKIMAPIGKAFAEAVIAMQSR